MPAGFEHGGPVDAVGLENILGDEMLADRPEAVESFPIGVIDAGQVIDQGIEPDIGDVVFVERQRNPPLQAAFGPGDAKVLQGFLQKSQHLVAVTLRADEVRILLDVVDQPLLVFAHAEEIILLLDELRLGPVVGAFPVHQLFFGEESLAAAAIMPAVFAEVDVPAS